MTGALETMRRYVANVNARDAEAMAALFAEDAVFHLPSGDILHGRGTIRTFYTAFFSTERPAVFIHGSVAENLRCAVELAVDENGKPRIIALDYVLVDEEGMIKRLVIYAPPAKDGAGA